ncbi:MAG: molybdopterin molybdenumtransferase MoeA, partial [Gammaproteobacteria bacterium]|nr:molybdopterin molybdenumtransferase MoeA [Gammaproteobacteria bacterium]
MTEALATIENEIKPISGHQSVALREALGRVLAAPIISPMNVPAHRNSAMDGYAMRGADLPAGGRSDLQMIGTAFAGKPFDQPLKAGECVRIMTGAKMP